MIRAFVAAVVLLSGSALFTGDAPKAASIYDFTVKNIDGQDVALSKYKGDVLLVINVASL
mgnify:CR=1 FL=1